MCGFAGIASPRPIGANDEAIVARMGEALRHRGPDDEGVFVEEGVALAHRRLSIIDLSADGAQPFLSECGRYALVYNGEIYNYVELREELRSRGARFKTATDTEVLLEAYREWGADALDRFNGMFAFAVYDRRERSLFLARDRFGIKPLYYAFRGEDLVFASEIKAIREVGGLDLAPDDSAIFDFLCFNRTDVFDETFHRGVRRLPKGRRAFFDDRGFRVERWYDPATYFNRTSDASEEEIVAGTRALVESATTLRLRSDVPVGSCLSGGLDSAIIAGIIAERGAPERYKTFTAEYPGDPIDETRYVNDLRAKYLFENYRTRPTADSAWRERRAFARAIDEPCASPTFYAQYEVMRLVAERGVTVALDGQGGDESFAGYQYFHGFSIADFVRRGKLLAASGRLWRVWRRRQAKEAYWTLLFSLAPNALKRRALRRTRRGLGRDFFEARVGESRVFNEFFAARNLNESLLAHFNYKLEHLLRMEDRSSMAFSVEARVPYLDHRLVEFLAAAPDALKLDAGETKLLQKRALGGYATESILRRVDKIGFGVPAAKWMSDERWRRLADESARFCRERLPGVFADVPLSDDPNERWKTIQLATWLEEAVPT
jgi:asparagine synthase (glutamine-hydrolysing)